ncbi:MAG: trypsin-like peptidase domain-containing protein, partial [Candidatus Methylomirabilales bacterium]
LVPTTGEPAFQDAQLEAAILRAKPAVVLISSEVGAQVPIACGPGPARPVDVEPIYETGSGFIIHPDGYIATNGHVVEQFYEMNERRLAREFSERAAAQACGPALAALPERARRERLQAIAARSLGLGGLTLAKKLQVHLSTGATYAAEVKAYSPAIDPGAPPGGQLIGASGGPGEVQRSGKDVAILKIDARNLPAAQLADRSAGLKIGEQLFIIGYPGVVLNHDFLSRKSRLESSVTVGRVSGFKLDVTDRRVIQTDAAISWGNSGGPAFSMRGEVIGAATFISTTLEGDQAIQGFNFLIPVETVHEFARGIGLAPDASSPFTREWERGIVAFFREDYSGAIQHLDAAERLVPGLPDVRALRTEAQLLLEKAPPFASRAWKIGGGLALGLGVALVALGVRSAVSSRVRRIRGRVRRLAPEEVRRRLEVGGPVAMLDARHGASFDDSPVQVPGSLRYDVDRPKAPSFQVELGQNGEVIAYCD